MADAFAPQLGSEVRFNQPVEQSIETPSTFGALAELGGFFAKAFAGTQEDRAAAAPKVDPNLATFRAGLERVESIRQERGETAALVAERQLAANFAMAGVSFGKEYEDIYKTTTGRPWAGYGMDVEANMLQETLKDPQVQASFVASYAVNKDWTEEQRIEYAIGQKATLEAANNEIARSKAEATYKWSVNTEAAYGTAIDTFINTSLGAMSSNAQQGGRVSPVDVNNLKAQWGQLKVQLSRPSNVSDDQWKATQEKIANIDNLFTTFEKAASSELLFEELATGFANAMIQGGEGSKESYIAGMTALKDPATLTNFMRGDVETFIMDVGSGDLKLDINQQDLFGHIIQDQGSLVGDEDPNSFLSTIPDNIKTNIDGKTPEQIYKGLEASGKLTSVVGPVDLNRPEAKEQFVTNAATIGAVLMNNPSDQFLSDAALKKLVANPQFVRNIITLDGVDPEAATVARKYVRSGLNTELARQQRNLSAIEANLGVVWNGSAYVLDKNALVSKGMTEEQANGFIAWVGKTYGGDTKAMADGLVPMPPGMNFNPVGLQQAYDRRASITTIGGALKALEVPTEQTASGAEGDLTVSQKNEPTAGVGSVTAQLLDRFEGGGDYDALFGFANREGGPFAGTKVSEMTIGELKNFANGEYADYSREQLGYKATPMGRFQFVGSTLSSVAQRMGLSDDTVFTPEVQNQMFVFHAKEVMAGKSQAGKRAAMRDTWEGLKNASDAELDQMISEVEGGTASFGTTGVSGGGFRGARPTDANAVAAAAGGAVERATAAQATTPAAAPVPPSAEAPVAATGEAGTADMPTDFSNVDMFDMNEGQAAPAAPQVDREVAAAQRKLLAEKAVESLPPKAMRQLRRLGIDPTTVDFFESDAEAEAAIAAGELSAGEAYVLPDGSVRIVEED